MEIIIIFILIFVIICLVYYIINIKKKLVSITSVLKAIKNGDKRKVFTKGRGVISQVSYEINEIISEYQNEVAELKKWEKSNKQLLTNLSHDVRTPLTSLLGYLDALESGIVTGEEKVQYIKIARNKAYDLKSFVDTLFEWFKLDSSERIFNFEDTDINEYSRKILIAWLPFLEQKNKKIEIDIAEDELIVYLDKDAYSRILNNLIQNAVLHSGCSILKIKIKSQENNVIIKVTDNGVGVLVEKLPHIFDRLYKCDDALAQCGSGLGLAIVKELVGVHNGTITAQSVPNETTTFTIKLLC